MQLKQLFVHFFLLIHVIVKSPPSLLEFTIVDEKEPVVGAVVHTLTSDKYYSSDCEKE